MIEHKHTYDKDGKQICCTQAEKIYINAGAKELLKVNKLTEAWLSLLAFNNN